jgi:hypothetical protein
MVLKPLPSPPVARCARPAGAPWWARQTATAGPRRRPARTARPGRSRPRRAAHGAPAQHVGVVVQAGAVRHGRGIDHGVIRVHIVHVGEIGQAMASRLRCVCITPLGRPVVPRCRTARPDPRRALLHRQRRGAAWLSGAAQHLQGGGVGAGGKRCIAQLGRHTDHARAAVAQHMGQLARMQLVVDGHRHRATPIDGMQRLQVLGAVGRVDGHALARLHTATLAQMPGQRRHCAPPGHGSRATGARRPAPPGGRHAPGRCAAAVGRYSLPSPHS